LLTWFRWKPETDSRQASESICKAHIWEDPGIQVVWRKYFLMLK
jgi:hypothetical protein